MKAVLCKQYGPPESLVVEEIPSKPLGKGEVRVALHAAGVNFPDVLIIQGKYQFKPQMPFSPGGEAAGEVTEVGEGVTGYKPGDRVIVMCGWGGFADELVIGQDRIIKMPPSMDYATGAAFLMTYGTSHHALKQRAQIKPGETLLVLGAAGGVGLAAVELGKVMGARVIAAASTDEKLELCRKYGADEVINYSREKIRDRVKELTGGKGADVIYDPVGGDAFDEAIRCINWEGRLLVIGFASGRIPQLPANLALLKGCQIVGVFWGDFTRREPELHRENLAEMMRWFEEGKLHPHISATYRMDQAADALNDMINRKVQGKAVLLTR
jgi:NADPH2:quinone reductase